MNDNDAWIQTYTGRRFYPRAPRTEDICVEDIAHALSNMCRFNGHCNRFYSVAEHSVLVSKCVEPEIRLWGLMHDAAEAYLSDITSPLKDSIREVWRPIEREVMMCVAEKFGMNFHEPEGVRRADLMVLLAERNSLFSDALPWALDTQFAPADVRVVGFCPHVAEGLFLGACSACGIPVDEKYHIPFVE